MPRQFGQLTTLDPQSVEDLLETADNDPEFLEELLLSFVEVVRYLPFSMQTAVQQQTTDELTRLAHQLKGSSGYLGAIELQRIFAKLQEQPPQNLQQVTELVEQIEKQIAGMAQDIAGLCDRPDVASLHSRVFDSTECGDC